MIGNDIVCLTKHGFSSRTSRYEQKVFCMGENRMLQNVDPEMRIALLWSVKESAFKCCGRQLVYNFVPTQFCIADIVLSPPGVRSISLDEQDGIKGLGLADFEHFTCSVDTPSGTIISKSVLCAEFVLTIAAGNAEQIESTFWGVKEISKTCHFEQSRQVRENMINHLIQKKHLSEGQSYSFSPTSNAPCLYINQLKCNILISFTHHRQFVAHAYRFT